MLFAETCSSGISKLITRPGCCDNRDIFCVPNPIAKLWKPTEYQIHCRHESIAWQLNWVMFFDSFLETYNLLTQRNVLNRSKWTWTCSKWPVHVLGDWSMAVCLHIGLHWTVHISSASQISLTKTCNKIRSSQNHLLCYGKDESGIKFVNHILSVHL